MLLYIYIYIYINNIGTLNLILRTSDSMRIDAKGSDLSRLKNMLSTLRNHIAIKGRDF